jgi:hypothetical protein
MLSWLSSIWNVLVKAFNVWKFLSLVALETYKSLAGFIFAAGLGIVTLVSFMLDLGQKIVDALSGQGTLGAYLAGAISGQIPSEVGYIDLDSAHAVAWSWINLFHRFIPGYEIFQLFVILIQCYIFAAAFRAIKAWIPTLA